jgi:hypothetical protein
MAATAVGSRKKILGLFEQIIFAGKIPEQEKVSRYCLAGAYVMPS